MHALHGVSATAWPVECTLAVRGGGCVGELDPDLERVRTVQVSPACANSDSAKEHRPCCCPGRQKPSRQSHTFGTPGRRRRGSRRAGGKGQLRTRTRSQRPTPPPRSWRLCLLMLLLKLLWLLWPKLLWLVSAGIVIQKPCYCIHDRNQCCQIQLAAVRV